MTVRAAMPFEGTGDDREIEIGLGTGKPKNCLGKRREKKFREHAIDMPALQFRQVVQRERLASVDFAIFDIDGVEDILWCRRFMVSWF